MDSLALLVQALSVGALGIYLGSMLTEGFVLVPWWRALDARAFHAWYAANDARLLRFFGATTAAGALAAWLAALAAWGAAQDGRGLAALAAALMLVVVLMFPLYFKAANARFSARSLGPDALAAELARWDAWHRVRTLLAALALAAALASLVRAA